MDVTTMTIQPEETREVRVARIKEQCQKRLDGHQRIMDTSKAVSRPCRCTLCALMREVLEVLE